jgi:hypothetical protein
MFMDVWGGHKFTEEEKSTQQTPTAVASGEETGPAKTEPCQSAARKKNIAFMALNLIFQ